MGNKFKGRALNLVVVVQEVDNINVTTSGLDLSGIVDANEKQKRGKVVSVGEGVPNLSSKFLFKFRIVELLFSFIVNFFIRKKVKTIKEGDEVIFDKFKMTPFTHDGVAYLLIDYRDIILVF